jgi:hypothetical protein
MEMQHTTRMAVGRARFERFSEFVCKKCLRFFVRYWLLNASQSIKRSDASAEAATIDSEQRGQKPNYWSRILLGAYIYAVSKLLVNMYFQYNYDIEFIKMIRLDQRKEPLLKVLPSKRKVALDTREYSEQVARVTAAKAMLKLIGSPFSELHLVNECVNFIMILVTCVIYANYNILFSLGQIDSLGFYFVRLKLDKSGELNSCRRLVNNVVGQMQRSSKNFVLNWAHRAAKTVAELEWMAGQRVRLSELSPDSMLYRQSRLHAYLAHQASLMAQGGHLMPINRSSTWETRMSCTYAAIAVALAVIFTVFDTSVLFVAPYLAGYLEFGGLADALFLVDVLLVMVLSIVSAVLMLPLLGAICPDQNHYLARLNSRLAERIKENDATLALGAVRVLLESPPATGAPNELEQLVRLLNRRLMRSLLEFEIFAEQFSPTQKSFSFVITSSTLLVMSVIGFLRIHAPYLEPELNFLSISFSLIVLMLYNLISVPISQIHYKGTKLYKLMSSLLAHSIESNLLMDKLVGQQIYTEHFVWLQRKILVDSERFIGKFSAHSYYQTFTMNWSNLIKLHFLCSLLLLSAFFQAKSWKSVFASRIDDPLGQFVDG